MQTQNIQRPALFSDFFGLELMWNNEYLTYIHMFIKRVTSQLNDIKKSLNNKNTQINAFSRMSNKSLHITVYPDTSVGFIRTVEEEIFSVAIF